MENKKKLTIIIFLALFVFVLLVLYVFIFYLPYDKANNLIASANKGLPTEFSGNEIISIEDYQKITGVSVIEEDLNFYINGGTFLSIKSIGINEISFKCTSNYVVYNEQSNEVILEVTNRKFTINMQFKDFKWVVKSVIIEAV